MSAADSSTISPPPLASTAAAGFVLRVVNIAKSFRAVRALRGVSFDVRRGDVHALVGENGAGKSTLMKILDGVYRAGSYEGQIELNGAPVSFRSPHDARLKGIGYVPQEVMVVDGLSVAENIFIGRVGAKNGKGVFVNQWDLQSRANRFLETCGIRLTPGRPASSLTASQRHLLMIARALSTEPSVLILDEPTASLTDDETANLFRIVRHLKSRGVTTIFITHKLPEVFEMADRVTVLRDGAVAGHFERGAFSEDELVTAMVGRKIETLFPPRGGAIGEEVLRVESLTVPHPHLAGRNVVDDVSFHVHRGEILGLGGLVGAGRSEVVSALYGRMPHAGRIVIEGVERRIRSPREARRAGIGLLTEERKADGLLFNFAIRENITIGSLPAVSMLRGTILNVRAEQSAAVSYMRRLAVRAPSASTLVQNLSGGNQQKVVLSKVLMAGPRILLLDEPTRGVDIGAKQEIYRLIVELADQGLAVVLISSELPELMGLCDRFVILASGRVTDRFNKADASEHRLMLAATGAGRAKAPS